MSEKLLIEASKKSFILTVFLVFTALAIVGGIVQFALLWTLPVYLGWQPLPNQPVDVSDIWSMERLPWYIMTISAFWLYMKVFTFNCNKT